jgi:hypothetical protein
MSDGGKIMTEHSRPRSNRKPAPLRFGRASAPMTPRPVQTMLQKDFEHPVEQ